MTAALHTMLIATAFLLAPGREERPSGSCALLPAGVTRLHTECVRLGTIVGAQLHGNRFVLYATEPRSGDESLLWTDVVAGLEEAAILYGPHYGFSLDFERSGYRKFAAENVGDLAQFHSVLKSSTHPAVRLIRDRVGALLERANTHGDDARADLKLRQQLAGALNDVLTRDIAAMTPDGQMSADVRPIYAAGGYSSRVGRLILEDVFQSGVLRDVAQSYVIRWKPESGDTAFANRVLGNIFNGGRAEAILLAADAQLKAFSNGYGVPPNVAFGPTELSLCATQFVNEARSGAEIIGNEHVNFFDFTVEYSRESRGLPGEVLWFRNPKLHITAKGAAGGRAPACAERFASALTNNLPRLLTDRGPVGERLRNLRTLLTLNRAIGWMIGIADVDLALLRSVPVRRDLANIPPEVVISPIVFAAGTKPVAIRISGGVRLDSGAPDAIRTPADVARPQSLMPAPAFEVSRVTIEGVDLLKIDASSVAGMASTRE